MRKRDDKALGGGGKPKSEIQITTATKGERMKRFVLVVVPLLVLSLVGLGSTAAYSDPGDLITVEGTVLDVTAAKESAGDGDIIRRHAHISVTSADDPSLVGTTVEVVADGGQVGDEKLWVERMPALDVGTTTTLEVVSGTSPLTVSSGSPEMAVNGPDYTLLYGFGWSCPDTMPGFYQNTSGAPSGAVTAINAGFRTWEDDSQSWMNFTYSGTTTRTGASNDGVNVVWWQSNADDFLARTWVYQNGVRITGFDVQFNSRFSFSTNPSSTQYDIQSVAAHEAGHDVGLGHTTAAGATMLPTLPAGTTDRRSLAQDDLDGLRFLNPYDEVSASFYTQSPGENDLILMIPGQSQTFSGSFTNTGKTPWGSWNYGNNPIAVKTTVPDLRNSPFCEASWTSCSNPRNSSSLICKGESISFSWPMKAPLAINTYDEAFGLQVDGVWKVKGKPRWREIIAQY